MKKIMMIGAAACALAFAHTASAQMSGSMMHGAGATGNPMVGGAPMMSSKNIVQNALESPDHKTLVAAVKAAGLVDTLMGPGPFTVFAPTDDAFNKLPPGTVQSLVQPAQKATLTKILTYHVVPGRMTSEDLRNQIQAKGGTLMLKTVAGEPLTFNLNGMTNIVVTDAKGGTAHIVTYDVFQSNGMIHVVDKVLMP